MKVVSIVVEDQRTFGDGEGFLVLRRNLVRNQREDGSTSRPYTVDFCERPRRRDAVVVAVYHRRPDGRVEVLIRRGLRPALQLGRPDEDDFFCNEVVAGVIEPEDVGPTGIRQRAVYEVWEESGFRVTPEQIITLGAHCYPSPGAFPEAFWLTACEVNPKIQAPLEGDGSPMEEGASTRWVELDAAIAECVAGTIRDLKTEVVLRRLRDHLHVR